MHLEENAFVIDGNLVGFDTDVTDVLSWGVSLILIIPFRNRSLYKYHTVHVMRFIKHLRLFVNGEAKRSGLSFL